MSLDSTNAGSPTVRIRASRLVRSRDRAALFVRLARPRQWPKNVLVFAAPAAAGSLFDAAVMVPAALAAVAFCLAASGTYFLNDSLDASNDRQHPRKCLRPIAAGLVTPQDGLRAGAALLALAIAVPLVVGIPLLAAIIATYVACQVAYSLGLKRVPVVELVVVASGFVLRFVAGGVAPAIALSGWFVAVTLFGSLLIVTGKRLSECVSLGEHRARHRAVLGWYTPGLLLGVAAGCAGGAVLGYLGWLLDTATRSGAAPAYVATLAPFSAGIAMFLVLACRAVAEAPEELLYSQRSMQLIGVTWVATFMLAVYAA